MKNKIFTFGFGVAVTAALAGGAIAELPTTQDSVSHEQLALSRQRAVQSDPMKSIPESKVQTKSEDPAGLARNQNPFGIPEIISYRGIATLVPKRAVLQVPKNYVDRLKIEPGCKLVSWKDFFALNRGWITNVEVTMVQAGGNMPIGEEIQKNMSKSSNLIVATCEGNPISVLPLKPAVEAPKK